MFDERRTVIIKDGRKLSFEYVPEKLVHREEQMSTLRMLFRPVFEDNRSETAFITGTVGTGKTATVKRFCEDLMRYGLTSGKTVDYVMVNCRQRSTENAIVLQILRHFDPGHPDRGFSVTEMLRALRGKVESKRTRLIVVLDEADILIKKNAVDIIYQLSRFNEESITSSNSVSLILIAQEYILDMIDVASLSTFKRTNTIRFSKYKRDELRDIVKIRSDDALFSEKVREDALDLIADISSEWGDARFAIDLLDKSARKGENKEHGELTAEEVREAKAMIYSVVTESKLLDLDSNRRMALLAIARSIKDKAYVVTGAAEKTYGVVCEEYGEKARKHTQFWTYVQDLERTGLIVTSVKGDTDGGRTTYISLPDIPSKVLASKLEDIMDE
ncbi:MAG: AAA family ATPase [Methanomassiliicoccaceae archaeon]|jgi:cell division control protein 6|nr:AAA family ATPase [Methanomassiliicoccaceae archaeon]